MTIVFTKSELDYLAVKIAEILTQRYNIGADHGTPSSNPIADKPIKELPISTRLESVLQRYNMTEWTLREISYYHYDEYKRFRGLGKNTYLELRELVASAGLKFGRYRFRRRDDHRDIIIEKPTERNEG